MMRHQRRHAGAGDMQPALVEILIGRREVAIGHLHHLDAGVFLQRQQHVIGQARRRGPVELAGLRLRGRTRSASVFTFSTRGRRHAKEIVDHRRDRQQILGIVRQPLMQQVIERDDAGKREQEGVVVARDKKL